MKSEELIRMADGLAGELKNGPEFAKGGTCERLGSVIEQMVERLGKGWNWLEEQPYNEAQEDRYEQLVSAYKRAVDTERSHCQ